MYKCERKCCDIKFANNSPLYFKPHTTNYKAGAFIFDPKEQRVLLVQSHQQYWGPPKGTIEQNETAYECAIREVREETGLNINWKQMSKVTKIKNRAIYYYVEMKWADVQPQSGTDNDANGITWIKLDCLEEFVKSGQIALSDHCRIAFKRFLDKTFPKSNFVVVRRKKRFSIR